MKRTTLRTVLAASVLTASFLAGFNASAMRNPRVPGTTAESPFAQLLHIFAPPPASGNDDAELMAPDAYRAAMAQIRDHYVGTNPGEARMTYAALNGMLETIGDPYTVFWNPAEYRENMETTTGDFVGIGARLETNKDRNTVVIDALDDSPALIAGMQAGDIITSINGKATIGVGIDDVVVLIKGPEGSPITVNVLRDGKKLTFTMHRAVVHSRVVEFRMIDPAKKIGYIQLTQFNEQADVQFDSALAKLEKQGMRALVFDLRDNPGGLFQVAQDLASRFLPEGPVVWVKEKSGQLSSLNVEEDKHRSPLFRGAYPVVVLVNGDSASAAEIVSGAIQDSKAGVLVGERTYGKGLVQTIMPLDDDSAVKITTQHYFTRDQHDINIKRDLAGDALGTVGGITPDFVVPFTDAQVQTQRTAQAANPKDKTIPDRYDPQLQKGLTIISGKLAAAAP